MFDLAAIQQSLREFGLDGWLLYDFRGLNILARRVVELPPERMLSRRWFYFIPAHGEPQHEEGLMRSLSGVDDSPNPESAVKTATRLSDGG